MKTILAFELPVEEDAYRKAINGARAFTSLKQMDDYIRLLAFSNPENKRLQSVKQEFWDILREQQISWLVIKD